MPGTPVPLGPWSGGMNNVAQESTIKDDELVLIQNFEQDLDGSLKSRPAIIGEGENVPTNGNMDLLGYYVNAAGSTYAVVAVNSVTKLYNPTSQNWQQIWDHRATGFVQYDNKAVLICDTASGGYWEDGVWTDTTTMPRGSMIIVYQERFWAFGVAGTATATTVWFSNLTVITPSSSVYDWTVARDYFDVGLGDGEPITGIVSDINTLLIFKSRSTWQFSYPSAPGQGTLRQVSSTIGAENTWSIVAYENYYLVYCAGYLYQFMNYRFYPVNRQKITFARSDLVALIFDIRLSLFGDRAILWFYGNLYVYRITTATWSVWVSDHSPGQFLAIPDTSLSGEARLAMVVTGEDDVAKKKMWRISEDVLTTGSGESFSCVMRTKTFSFDQAAQFKRLLYWTVETSTSTGIEAIAHPVIVSSAGTTWNEMALHTWTELAEGSWNNPILVLPVYQDTVDFPTIAPVQTLTKVTARFRALRMYFEVFLACTGTIKTAPARVYSVTPYLKVHAHVSSKVS